MPLTPLGFEYPAGSDTFDFPKDQWDQVESMRGHTWLPCLTMDMANAVATALAASTSRPVFARVASQPPGLEHMYTTDAGATWKIIGQPIQWTHQVVAPGDDFEPDPSISILTLNMRRWGMIVDFLISFTWTGSVAIPEHGNIANIPIARLGDSWIPRSLIGISSAASGRLTHARVASDGEIHICSISPGGASPLTSQTWSFAATWMTRDAASPGQANEDE